MIVDSSALVAILRREPGHEIYQDALETNSPVRISAANYFETSIVIDSRREFDLSMDFDRLMEGIGIQIEPVTPEHARIARQAYRDYGRGSGHRANLNFGDCFTYALARDKREPVLFKGNDFQHTDLTSAVPSDR
jgi:ribonuclease VapC